MVLRIANTKNSIFILIIYVYIVNLFLAILILLIKYSYHLQTCARLYFFEYLKIIIIHRKICTLPFDGSLTGITTPGQKRSESNGDEKLLYIPQTSSTRVSP